MMPHHHENQAYESGMTCLLVHVLQKLDILIGKVDKMSAELDPKVAELTAAVSRNTSAIDSAVLAFAGLNQLLLDAIAAATAAGATPEQLQSFTDLSTTIDAKAAELSAAITAGTPAAARR